MINETPQTPPKRRALKEGYHFGWFGHPPEGGELLAENEKWALYKLMSSGPVYLNLKLIRKQRDKSKANYYLAWKYGAIFFVETSDLRVLEKYNLAILRWVIQKLKPFGFTLPKTY